MEKVIKDKKIIAIMLLFVAVLTALLCFSPYLKNALGISDKPSPFGANVKVAQGIDVSEHNNNVDWNKVKKSGVDFAYIRVGFRGYESGNIVIDKTAMENLEKADDAGMKTGVYFYSQATTKQEAREEAKFVINIIEDYTVTLPIAIDFEYPYDSNGERTGRLVEAALSPKACAYVINEFCETVEDAGYRSMVYSSSNVFKYDIDMSKISKRTYIWVADYNSEVTYEGDFDVWQYSKTGKVNGIGSKYVDLNKWIVK